LKALLEGIIYVAPEPVTLDGILKVLEGEDRDRVKAKLDELVADYEQGVHGIQIRQVANGYKFSTKAEHHEVLRRYVKSLKPLMRLSKPALETLAVIAYRQPATMPEIEEIRGVDSGGVIHTLLEKKLVVTGGRKNVVGRPILYRTSKEFLVHFGLNNVGELPSLKEFEEMARRALGSELTVSEAATAAGDSAAVPDADGAILDSILPSAELDDSAAEPQSAAESEPTQAEPSEAEISQTGETAELIATQDPYDDRGETEESEPKV
jgi:segregation and condensation protein B